ncbi:VOC family protein [Actinomadura physcomitrii]|uniref:VOC family protein n=1 Tax=Actinomadura physcomitrii TaxID=2650748 RepID=UPI001370A24C|nr:VOC family protein [Actinomadura physcomitrii]
MELVFVLDCADPDALADFWAAALGYERGGYDPPYVGLTDPRGRNPRLLLQRVPEPKAGKNRMHLDLRVADMDAELAHVTALGAHRCRRWRSALSTVSTPRATAGSRRTHAGRPRVERAGR